MEQKRPKKSRKKDRKQREVPKKNQWHPGFAAAIRMELKENREDLAFEEEHTLSKKPLQMDMLVIKNDGNVEIKNKIGKIFRRFNIVEYKSPDDKMGVDVFFKVIGYACLYKVSSEHENGYTSDEITITLIRQRYPAALMKHLKQNGYRIQNLYPGIYYVSGNIMFRLQILVTKNLDKTENIWLHSLRKNITKETYGDLIASVEELEPRERELYGEAILQIVTNANDKNIEKWKEENEMTCEALQRIMAPELEESRRKGLSQGRLEGRTEGRLEGKREGEIIGKREGEITGKVLAYADMGLSLEAIAEKVSLTVTKIEEILAET